MTATAPTPRPALTDLAVGDVVATGTVELERSTLVRYAGASGDFNPIHWDESFATEVGLPGVIAHGMCTMGSVVGVVVDWVGDPGAVVRYGTRFTKPVPVPLRGASIVEVSAAVGALDPEAGTARIDLTVVHEGVKVLGRTQVVVRLS